MKFNVGDLVIGNCKANDRYGITKMGWIGVVIEVKEQWFSAAQLDMSRNIFKGLEYDCFDKYYGLHEIQSDLGLRVTTVAPTINPFLTDKIITSASSRDIKVGGFTDTYKSTQKSKYGVEKVIFNKPATIVFAKGNKYKVKASLGEKFDKEKGLALALLKMFGISYPDLKRMIKNADDQDAKKKKEKKKNGRK